MKKIIVPGLLMSLFFVSCTNFFTNSWGKWAARDPASLIPKVTASNVDDLISKSENNPDLSLEVLKKIGSAVGSASGSDKAHLQNAAITAAVNASNLTTTLLNNASNVSNLEDADEVKDLITNTLNSMNNLTSASDNLTGILAQDTAFMDSASADDLALAAALILAGEAKKQGSDIFNDYENASIPPESQAAVDLAEILATKAQEKYDAGENANSPLKDLLDKLGIVPPSP
jgi:hypothetical protein